MRHDTRSAALHHQRRVARRRLTHQIGAPISRIKRISATPIIPGQSTILHERPTPTTTFRESPGLDGASIRNQKARRPGADGTGRVARNSYCESELHVVEP